MDVSKSSRYSTPTEVKQIKKLDVNIINLLNVLFMVIFKGLDDL